MKKILIPLLVTTFLFFSCTSVPSADDFEFLQNSDLECEVDGFDIVQMEPLEELKNISPIPNLGRRDLILASFFDDVVCTWNEESLNKIRGLTEWVVTPAKKDTIVLQLGIIEGDQENSETGFILYDDSNKGYIVSYRRRGIEKEWSWEDYRCVLRSDDTILYYDFSGLEDGEKTKPKEILRAKKVFPK